MADGTRNFLALRAGTNKGRPIRNNRVPTLGTDQVALNRGHFFEVDALDTVWTPLLVHRCPNHSIFLVQNTTVCLDSIGVGWLMSQ